MPRPRPCAPRRGRHGSAATDTVGNASSIHGAGQAARRLLEESRERLAAALECDPVEVVFTSGGTESVNLGITGLYRARRETTGRNAIVAPLAEHHATLDTLTWLHAHEVAELEWVPVDRDARLDLDAWRERGGRRRRRGRHPARRQQRSRNPAAASRKHPPPASMPMCPCTWTPSARSATCRCPSAACARESGSRGTGLVALSVAAHKLGGPVGVGALVVAREAQIEPLLHGGGQQRGLRAGTQDAAGAAAFAVAAEMAVAELDAESARVGAQRDRLEAELRAAIPGIRVSAADAERLPGHLHIVFPGAQGDSLLLLLDAAGIAVSTGSACQAGVPEPSHVVRAMGLGDEPARSALRFTLGRTTTDADVDAVIDALPAAYERARAAGLSSRRVRERLPGSTEASARRLVPCVCWRR